MKTDTDTNHSSGSLELPEGPAKSAELEFPKEASTPAADLAAGESLPDHPFDGVVRDHAVAWQHVSAAYLITFALLSGYILVVTFLLRRHSTKKGRRP